jgi:hypothetical protein
MCAMSVGRSRFSDRGRFEDASVMSSSSTVTNAEVGYKPIEPRDMRAYFTWEF